MDMIKLFREQDLEKLVDFTKELKDNLSPDHYTSKYINSEAYRNYWFKQPQFITHYSERHEKVEGFIIMSPRGLITLELDMLYVTPTERREGVAMNLKQACVNWGVDHKYQFIVSQVGATNHPSIALNNKSGWKINTQSQDIIVFYKKLGNESSYR